MKFSIYVEEVLKYSEKVDGEYKNKYSSSGRFINVEYSISDIEQMIADKYKQENYDADSFVSVSASLDE